jgi:hypothetical protein
MMRMLQRDGNPTQLGEAIAHYGRIFKTLHILTASPQALCLEEGGTGIRRRTHRPAPA